MLDSAEVVVVGAGAIGTSVAYHLAEMGLTDVVVVERDVLGSGSTSKAAGGIRTQFSDELNVRIGIRSLAEFEAFTDLTGVDIGFQQTGYLFLLDNEADANAFRASIAVQRQLGLPNVELMPGDATTLVPGLVSDDLVAATFSPRDGHATPEAVVSGYAATAAKRGVRFRQGEEVTAISVNGGRVVGVETNRGSISTGVVVCAAGAWSREIAATVGIDLPVFGERRFLHYVAEDGGLPPTLPLTIDFATGLYFHREGPGLVFGAPQNDLEDIAAAVNKRLPILAELPVQASWSGLYEMSPDHNGFVGEADTPQRLFYATGFSGHGFQQAPAVGEHLAQLVAHTPPTLDLSPLSLRRLGDGLRAESMVV